MSVQGRDFPLLRAAQTGDERAALRALKEGASPWAVDTVGDSALEVAARHGHASVCALLLRSCESSGKDPLSAPLAEPFFLALEQAARKNRQEALDFLLGQGRFRAHAPDFAPLWQEALGRAFEASILKGDGSAAEALLEAGLDPNLTLREPARKRPLHLCALNGELRLPAAKALLERGADPSLADAAGQTPLHELLASGARWLSRQDAGSDAARAVEQFVSLLADFGARPSDSAGFRKSPQALARELGPRWMAELMDKTEALAEREALGRAAPAAPARGPKTL